jgi:hypothetical protein
VLEFYRMLWAFLVPNPSTLPEADVWPRIISGERATREGKDVSNTGHAYDGGVLREPSLPKSFWLPQTRYFMPSLQW